MKRKIKYTLFLVFAIIFVEGKAATTEWGAVGQDFTLTNNYTIARGDTVIVLGNFFDTNKKSIFVRKEATLVVHGNMKLINKNTQINGNVVVLGDVDLKNTIINRKGNLVVGGTLKNTTGNLWYVRGDVYLLDEEANNPLQVSLRRSPLDIEDLLKDDNDKSLIDIISDNVGNTGVTYNWDGSESDDWNAAANWSSNKVPNALDVIVIDNVSTHPECPSVLTIQDITVKAGARFCIPQGSQITILGDITVESGAELIVKNSNTSPTSFIVYGDVSGDITFEWTYNNTRWWFIGHPISNAQMAHYNDILTTNGGTNRYVLYDLQDPDVFAKVSQTSFDFSAQSPIKGYLFKVKDDNTPLVMTGTINNDDVYTKTLQSDWQIISNPYPSYYQIPTKRGAGSDFENTTGDIYVTVSTSNSDKVFHTYNSALGIGSPSRFDGIIAPGQAFYVQTKTAGDIKMRAANRVHSVTTQLKSGTSTVSEKDVLRIQIKNENGLSDEAVITFIDGEQPGFTQLDSKQRFNKNDVSYIYSVIEDNQAVINALPTGGGDISQTIGVQTKAGNHFIYIDGIDSLTVDYEIILEDKLTGVRKEMFTGTTYEFESEEGVNDERFILHFLKKAVVATSVDEEKVLEGVTLYVEDGNYLNVICEMAEEDKFISIYSVSGDEVLSDIFAGRNYKQRLNLASGVYIINISDGVAVYQQKILIN